MTFSTQGSGVDLLNESADFWRYDIGVNVIPANTMNKKPLVLWATYQDRPITEWQHEQWKNDRAYSKGLAVIVGKVWHRPDKIGQYLIFLDADKQGAITELFARKRKTISLREASQKFLIEQHKDSTEKAHIYFYSPIPFPHKSADSLLGLEVKGLGEHGIAFCSRSNHKNGERYEIIGTDQPLTLSLEQAREYVQHIDQICLKYGLPYLEKYPFLHNPNLTAKFKNMINTLILDTTLKITKGHRHTTLISVADSLLFNHLGKHSSKIKTEKMLKEFFEEINRLLCEPEPLPDNEVSTIWSSALGFVSRVKEAQEEKNKTQEKGQNGGQGSVKEYTVYKYSKDIPLAEEILLGNQSVFLQIINGEPVISERIELSKEKSIILKPHENSAQIMTPVVIPYSFKDIDEIRYFVKIAKEKSIDNLLLMSESLWNKLLVAKDREVKTFYSIDTIYSYFQDFFPTTHYDMIIGNPGAGKGAILVSFRLQAYRAVMASGMSGANLLELLGPVEACQVTLLEDEFQNIDKDPDKEGLYKIGYDETNLVPKTLDGNKSSRHNSWYHPYCFKVFAAEKPPESKNLGGFNDRTFRIKSLRGKPKILSKNLLHESQKPESKQNPKYKDVISKIQYLRNLLLIYRLLHSEDIIDEANTNIDGRALELTGPQIYLFSSDKLISKDREKRVLHDKVLPTLSKFLREKGELTEKTIEGVVYEALRELFTHFTPEIIRDVNGETRTKYTISYGDICDKVRELVDGTPDSFHDQTFISVDYGQTTHNEILDICKNKFLGERTWIGSGNGKKRAMKFDTDDVEKVGKSFDVISRIEIIGEQAEDPEEEKEEEDLQFWKDWKEKKDNENNTNGRNY